MQVCFCDGWMQRVSDQDQEPGSFPPGIRRGRGSRYVWLILPDVSSAQGTEPLNLHKPCSTYLATSLYQGVNMSALHTKNTEQKKAESWYVISFHSTPFKDSNSKVYLNSANLNSNAKHAVIVAG